MFADDLNIFRRIDSFDDCLSLQDELNTLVLWFKSIGLQFNIDKYSSDYEAFCARGDYVRIMYYELELGRDESKELQLTVDTLRTNESGLKKQINGLKQDIIREQSENGILTKRIHELEKQKTVYVCRSEDITVTKKELKKCMDEKESCENRFSNLDCPFYQSKYGKLEDKMPKIKYGSINESHYIKKISVLEQQIKNLHSKIHSQGEEQRKYEEKVGEVWHENKNLKKSLEELNALLEKQTEVINYDKVKMMGKDSKIRNLEGKYSKRIPINYLSVVKK
ncbi:cancer-associated gene 1 protein homolog [Acyrthosiphon pisum]|uniref:Uncharacterized protein n=1 Tax=Acyrthosiphon pisum TaxID=7029 RepID=A0A8R2JLF1_ACYPI|nr:cancer-associated gene 1 protein homolog [Acyrthosiphon pisum]